MHFNAYKWNNMHNRVKLFIVMHDVLAQLFFIISVNFWHCVAIGSDSNMHTLTEFHLSPLNYMYAFEFIYMQRYAYNCQYVYIYFWSFSSALSLLWNLFLVSFAYTLGLDTTRKCRLWSVFMLHSISICVYFWSFILVFVHYFGTYFGSFAYNLALDSTCQHTPVIFLFTEMQG
jgi:hypothetical protein